MSYENELLAKRQKIQDAMVAVSRTNDTREFRRLQAQFDEVDAKLAGVREPRFDYPGEDVHGGKSLSEFRTLGDVKRNKKYQRTREDEAFTAYLRGGPAPEYRAALDGNAMSTVGVEPGIAGPTGYSAGYMIPQGFFNQLIVALKAYGGLANDFKLVVTPTGNPMPFPTVDPTAIRASYVSELQQLGFGGDSAGTDYQFGQGMLNAYAIVSGVILASVQLVRDSAFDVDAFASDRIGEAIGRKVAAEAFSGSGATSMLGINTALAARAVRAPLAAPFRLLAVMSSSGRLPRLRRSRLVPILNCRTTCLRLSQSSP